MSGRERSPLVPGITLAVDNVNAAGGIAGRRLAIEWIDTASGVDVRVLAEALAADPEILAVIGPEMSRDFMAVADILIAANKPLVSPSATAGDIYRAYGSSPLIFRTVASDIAQTKVFLSLAKRSGARRVALHVPQDAYGNTFFDWFSLLATELDLESVAVDRHAAGSREPCDAEVTSIVGLAPDMVLVVPEDPAKAICFLSAYAAIAPGIRTIYSDMAQSASVFQYARETGREFEGLVVVPDPAGGFAEYYRAKLGAPAPAFAAQAYDAVLLLAYGLVQTNGAGGVELATAMRRLGAGSSGGLLSDSSPSGIAAALTELALGRIPSVMGAGGPLRLDPSTSTEVLSSTYAHVQTVRGEARVLEYVGEQSLSLVYGATSHLPADHPAEAPAVPPRAGMQAVVVSTSCGWGNYRHQADALAVRRHLERNLVPRERIALVTCDDLARHPSNSEPDTVRHEVGGENLWTAGDVHRALSSMSVDDLWRLIAEGKSGTDTERNDATDLFVYLVGHGTRFGLSWDGAGDKPFLTAEALSQTVEQMRVAKRYRRLLLALEGCEPTGLTATLRSPQAMILAGAAPNESSFATAYDPSFGIWRADEFSVQLLEALRTSPGLSLLDLAQRLYLRVPGSHVTLYNAASFDQLATVPAAEFFGP